MALLLSNWRLVLEVVIVGLLVAYGVTMKAERDTLKAEYAEYRTLVAKAAQAAAEESLKKTIEDEKRKEAADAENMRLNRQLADAARRLRDARAASNFVPAASPGAASPERACFGRTELERTLQQLDAGIQELITEGDRAVIDLDTARRWAQGR